MISSAYETTSQMQSLFAEMILSIHTQTTLSNPQKASLAFNTKKPPPTLIPENSHV